MTLTLKLGRFMGCVYIFNESFLSKKTLVYHNLNCYMFLYISFKKLLFVVNCDIILKMQINRVQLLKPFVFLFDAKIGVW